jgi:hypothetical protein
VLAPGERSPSRQIKSKKIELTKRSGRALVIIFSAASSSVRGARSIAARITAGRVALRQTLAGNRAARRAVSSVRPNKRAEFNHTQLVPTKKAPDFLRRTITASEPKDLQKMWLASGVTSYVGEVTAAFARPPALASAANEQPLAPAIDWQPPIPRLPGQRTAPRTRVRHAGRRGGQTRSTRLASGRGPRNLDWMREVLTSS